jgi:hypothetical protein
VFLTKVVFVDESVTVQAKLVGAALVHPAGQVVVAEKVAVVPAMTALRLTLGQQLAWGGGCIPGTENDAWPNVEHAAAAELAGKTTVQTTLYVPPVLNGRAPICAPFNFQLAPGSFE